MTIRPFLADKTFDPETIQEMSSALEGTCKVLGLTKGDDAATRLVAKKIIELAQRGFTGAETLQTTAVRQFKADWPLM
ncbi:MAG: hypothetical protein WBD95_27315 [Xanthobacteraceae bacterium]